MQPRAHPHAIPGKIAEAAIVVLLTAIWGLGIAAVVSLVSLP